MEKNKKKDILIFLGALVLICVVFLGGILYLKAQAKPDVSVAQVATSSPVMATGAMQAADTGSTTVSDATSVPQSVVVLPVPVAPLSLPYSLAAQSAVQAKNYWPETWGNSYVAGGNLTLISATTTNGASSFLNGAGEWTNYAVGAKVAWITSGRFDIAVRVANDAQNFVYCEFGSSGTGIIQRVNGVDTQIAYASTQNVTATGTMETFGMAIYDNDVSCDIAGTEVIGAQLGGGESPSGGIGLITWGSLKDHNEVVVSSVSVAALIRDAMTIPFPVPAPVVVLPPVTTTTVATSSASAPAVAAEPTSTPAAPTSTLLLTIPYSETNFTGDTNWSADWGISTIDSSGFLDMTTSKGGTGGTVILKNLTPWSDGTFTVNLNWVGGEAFGLIARYKDSKNYVLCNFDEQDPENFVMRLEQYINGREITLGQSGIVNLSDITDRPNITASIQLAGLYGTCSLNKHEFSNQGGADMYVINAPYAGGIGITMYDPTAGMSKLIVQSVGISE